MCRRLLPALILLLLCPSAGVLAGEAAGRGLERHRVVIFTTPGRKEFNEQEKGFIEALEEAGFSNVESAPGRGGTNPEANIKLARGQESVGEIVREIARRHFGTGEGDFRVAPVFSPEDPDIFINLGPYAPPLDRLEVGEDAPPLDVAEWLNGDPITLERGRVYVVEFWATWCGPCRESIPHLSQLQEKYAGQGLVIVGLTGEDAETVRKFMEEVPFGYRVALDRSTARHYMTGVPGIPHAFVIDRDGKVAWQGHPLELDPVLERVLAGNFDRQVAARQAALEREMQEALMRMDVEALKRAVDEILALDPGDRKAAVLKLLILREEGTPQEYWSFAEAQAQRLDNDPSALVELGMTLLSGDDGFTHLELAHRVARRAVELSGEKEPAAFHLLARVLFEGGFLEEARAAEERALALDPENPEFKKAHAYYGRCLEFHRSR